MAFNMLISNSINIPLAVFTVILRRFIDRIRYSEPQLPIACRASIWLDNHSPLRSLLYSYLLIAAMRFILKQMERSGLSAMVNGYTQSLCSTRDRMTISNTSASLNKALTYVTSLSSPLLSIKHRQAAPKNYKPPYYNYDLSLYTFNPHSEPKSDVPKSQVLPILSANQSIASDNESCVSDEINTILSPRDGFLSSGPTAVSSITTTTLSSEIPDNEDCKGKENLNKDESTSSPPESSANSNAGTSSHVARRKRGKRRSTTQMNEMEGAPCRLLRKTGSGKTYNQNSKISKSRKK